MLESVGIGVDTVCKDLAQYLQRSRGRGRPGKDPCGLAKAVLVQQYVEMANRPLAGALSLYCEKLGLAWQPGYKDVERAYQSPDVTVILLGLLELSVKAVRDERVFAVDGTGLSTSIKDNWERYLLGQRRYGVFEKLVCVVGQRYGVISAFRVLESMHGHESPVLRPLVEEVVKRHGGVGMVCGDSAFFSRENCSLVGGLGGVPRFYPKKNASLKSLGCREYQDMLLSFIGDAQVWLEEYHQRYVCESAFSSLKRRCLLPLRRRVVGRRKLEVLARVVVYNLVRLSYSRWTKDLDTSFASFKRLAR